MLGSRGTDPRLEATANLLTLLADPEKSKARVEELAGALKKNQDALDAVRQRQAEAAAESKKAADALTERADQLDAKDRWLTERDQKIERAQADHMAAVSDLERRVAQLATDGAAAQEQIAADRAAFEAEMAQARQSVAADAAAVSDDKKAAAKAKKQLDTREAALNQRAGDMDAREQAIADREAAAARREQAVEAAAEVNKRLRARLRELVA